MAKDFFKVYDHWSLFTIFRIKIRTDAYTHLFSNSKSFANMYIYMIFIILIMYMGDVMQRPEEGIIYLGRGAKGTCSLLSVCSRD